MKTDDFLKCLEKKEVQAKIKTLFSEWLRQENHSTYSPNDSAVNENSCAEIPLNEDVENNNYTKLMNLNKEVERISLDNTELKEQIKKLEAKNNELQKTIDTVKQEYSVLVEKFESHKNSFAKTFEIYSLFQALSNDTKNALKNIFSGEGPIDFITSGTQDNNIHNFWEYIKAKAIENPNKEVNDLATIFLFLFTVYQNSFDMYELLDTQVGETFHSNEHILHTKSTSKSGIVSQIYLLGYKNTKTNKIIKQSIITIG